MTEDEIWRTIGDRIKTECDRRGLSALDMAERIGVVPHTIRAIWRGEPTRLTTLYRIADALGVPVRKLLPRVWWWQR